MKVTDPDVIRVGEMDLLDAVKDDLDWDAVRKIVADKLKISSLESRGGEIVVHNGQVAFRMDLELKMLVSLMFDRNGNYIPQDDEKPGAQPPEADAGDSVLPEADVAESVLPETYTVDSMAPETHDALEMEADFPAQEGGGLETGSDDRHLTKGDDALNGDGIGDSRAEGDIEISAGDGDFSEENYDENFDDILKDSQEFWEQKIS